MSSPAARNRFEEALRNFRSRLTSKEDEQFQTTTLHDLKETVIEIQQTRAAKSRAIKTSRIQGILELFCQFGEVVEAFLHSSDFMAFVWGPMKFLLQVASNYTTAFVRLLNIYQQIGVALPLAEKYSELFHSDEASNGACAAIYEDILKFHTKVLCIFTSRSWQLLFESLWKSMQPAFNSTIADIQQQRRLIESHAAALYYIEAREARLQLQAMRTQLDQLLAEKQKEDTGVTARTVTNQSGLTIPDVILQCPKRK